MRCFIAIEIDQTIRSQLGRLQRDLQGRLHGKRSELKWVQPGLIHLTLKFLGEVRDSFLPEVTAALKSVAEGYESFPLHVGQVGSFGRPAKVVWVGVEDHPSLLGLQRDLETKLEPLGFPPESRSYSGHLTLCRVRSRRAGAALDELIKVYPPPQFGSFYADSVCLFKSDLTKTGPVYTVLSKVALY